jgi:hypothetical protein
MKLMTVVMVAVMIFAICNIGYYMTTYTNPFAVTQAETCHEN